MSKTDRFWNWLNEDEGSYEPLLDISEAHDAPRAEIKARRHELDRELQEQPETLSILRMERKGFGILYSVIAITSCLLLIGVLLYTIANLPLFGQENPRALEVTTRYVEDGLAETGAVNIVAGMILDYRAFDTLGESHVLFTALICVMILLRRDPDVKRRQRDDYYRKEPETYFPTQEDGILQGIGAILVPSLLVFGIYVLLNGQLSPGGGFSGGAVLGASMIIYSAAFGFDPVDAVLTMKRFMTVGFCALAFYSFAKGYVFFMGANGLENHIPKGIPGAILSGGLILPLDIAVGIVVACTMYGFYSLFRRGRIGSA